MNETMVGASYDKLLAGDEGLLLRNVRIASDTTVERGALLAGTFDGTGTTVHLATTADTVGSELFIAATDSASVEVITAYESGRFNRSAVKSTVPLSGFELEMRKQGLRLTEVI